VAHQQPAWLGPRRGQPVQQTVDCVVPCHPHSFAPWTLGGVHPPRPGLSHNGLCDRGLCGAPTLHGRCLSLRGAAGSRLPHIGRRSGLFSRFAVASVPFAELTEVREIDVTATGFWRGPEYFFARRLGNRFAMKGMMLRRRRGLIRVLLITPRDLGAFAKEVVARAQRQGRT
jgi:hypothetical protein